MSSGEGMPEMIRLKRIPFSTFSKKFIGVAPTGCATIKPIWIGGRRRETCGGARASSWRKVPPTQRFVLSAESSFDIPLLIRKTTGRRSMPLWQHYHLAKSIPDALEALDQADGPARVLAGGTDLLLEIEQGRHPPVHTLVDVTCVPEMRVIENRADHLFIGAAVPLSKVVAAALVKVHAEALAEACQLIGGPQVRNTATLGGNVGHALPAADGTIALLALGAEVEVVRRNGARRVPLQDLFSGPGVSNLDPLEELILGFYLPFREKGQASAFRRVMRPQGVALPILNMAVWLQRDEDLIAAIRIGLGPAGAIPMRARAAEEILHGCPYDEKNTRFALSAILDELHFRSSPQRASAAYRRHLSAYLLGDTLFAAWQRAGGPLST